MPNKHRHDGVKEEHTIVQGLRKKLRKIATCPYIQAVTPGRISAAATGSKQPVIVFQYFQDTGMKLLGKAPGNVQEIFVVTANKEATLDWLVTAGLVQLEQLKIRKTRNRSRKRKPPGAPPLAEASPTTIEKYMSSMQGEADGEGVSIADRLNGQYNRLQQLRKELEKQELARTKSDERRSNLRQKPSRQNENNSQLSPARQPETLEEWLQLADELGLKYWKFGKK